MTSQRFIYYPSLDCNHNIRKGSYLPIENTNLQPNWEERIDDFDQMELKPDLQYGIFRYGLDRPSSEIQSLAIKPITQGHNVVAQIQPCPGKICAFSIGILQIINTDEQLTQALILTPTSELVNLTYTILFSIGTKMNGLTIAKFDEETLEEENQKDAQQHPHVVVATPHRALDLIKNGYLKCENLSVACFDEADLLFELSQIQEIIEYFQENMQILLFAATITKHISIFINNSLIDPVKILVKPERLLSSIPQFYVNVEHEVLQFPMIREIYSQLSIQQAVIFANSEEKVAYLDSKFQGLNFHVSAIYEGLNQHEIQQALHEFQCGTSRVLVATDFIAKFLDISSLTLVINCDMPLSIDNYIHRIRVSGKTGFVINICTEEERQIIQQIKTLYNASLDELPEYFGEIGEQGFNRLID